MSSSESLSQASQFLRFKGVLKHQDLAFPVPFPQTSSHLSPGQLGPGWQHLEGRAGGQLGGPPGSECRHVLVPHLQPVCPSFVWCMAHEVLRA